MTRLDPFFSYYGAGFRKCRAGFYPPPRDGDLIVERFAGSAAYACTFGAGREVLLIDLDPRGLLRVELADRGRARGRARAPAALVRGQGP